MLSEPEPEPESRLLCVSVSLQQCSCHRGVLRPAHASVSQPSGRIVSVGAERRAGRGRRYSRSGSPGCSGQQTVSRYQRPRRGGSRPGREEKTSSGAARERGAGAPGAGGPQQVRSCLIKPDQNPVVIYLQVGACSCSPSGCSQFNNRQETQTQSVVSQ